MSAAPGLEAGAARPRPSAPPPRRPPLALVPARRAAPASALGRTPFVVLVVALLAAGLLGLLVLNTVLAQDAFRLHTLKQDSRALQDQEQVLQREVEALRAPQALAARAGALGMVQAGPPAFLRLPDGAVLGAGSPTDVGAQAQVPPAADPDMPPAAPDATAAPDAADAPDASAGQAPAETAEDSP